jgi:hypothetical protein
MDYTYAVFGAGRQGTAATYDMGRCVETFVPASLFVEELRRRGLIVYQESRV